MGSASSAEKGRRTTFSPVRTGLFEKSVVGFVGAGVIGRILFQQGKESGAQAQQWQIDPVPNGSGLYHFVNAASGKRLDVANASTENGANIQQWRANNFGAQEWIIEQHLDAPGTVTIVSFISGLLLEVESGSTDDGANVRQWEDTDSPGQWWRLEPCS
ncbi:RICIN domain-containing protein [Streptomyces sp. NPDC005408]|uniref:RICIN domain-containing protein n=1 Tax=Streptomyces sp. NPDC005408 TaxID=3155341 RepID=UPI0033A5AE10